MAEALLAGAVLGAVFGELGKIVSEAIARCVNFKQTLTRLLDTLESLGPVIEDIQKQNNELGRRKEELDSLLCVMKDGKQLVLECSDTYWFDCLAKILHEKKLEVLINKLERFITIDLQVQTARDQKETLLLVKKMFSKVEKLVCVKVEENTTASSSSHDSTTPATGDHSSATAKPNMDEQLEHLFCHFGIGNSFTNPFASNYSMTSSAAKVLESSTNANENEVDPYVVLTLAKDLMIEGGLSVTVISAENLPAADFMGKSDPYVVLTLAKELMIEGGLSVTVISAENLPAADFMGKSDPYVVLTLAKEKSKEKVEKQTRVVNYSLNPVWNQTLDFVVENGLHDMLIVEVWDHDTIGKDFIGRCTLSLTRVLMEKEYNERFKLVGAESSYLNLHLKWMQYPIYYDLELKPVGILKVKLLQAEELTKNHIFRKSDAFVVLYIQASGEEKKKSETINNDSNPIWNERFEFTVEDVSTKHLIVEVYDSKHSRSSKLIGCAQIQLSDLQPGKVKYVWSKLVKSLEIQRDNKNRGQIHVELLYCPFGMEDSFTSPFAPNYSGVLSVTVISAEDLPALDFMRKSDPYVVLTLRKAKSKEEIRNKTRVVNQNLNPVWDQTFGFVVEDGLHDMVVVEVWDKDTFGKDYMGRCILSLTKVILEGEYTESFELVGAKSGSLKLHLKWKP